LDAATISGGAELAGTAAGAFGGAKPALGTMAAHPANNMATAGAINALRHENCSKLFVIPPLSCHSAAL
jgi:hypothetical protein